jgi:hypothetical protein
MTEATPPPAWIVLPGPGSQEARIARLVTKARAAFARAVAAFEALGLPADDLRATDALLDALLSNPEPEAEASALRALSARMDLLRVLERELRAVLEVSR